MDQTSREFQVFIKPVGAICNLRCSYCYYLSRKELYPAEAFPRMKEELLEEYIRQQFDATTDDTLFFSWHGGEPTLAGLEFYRKAVALQKKMLPQGKRLLNGIQTNGTRLDEAWCRFLARENFLVGISMDGPEEFHNLHRRDRHEKGTFNDVLRGWRLLQKFGVTTEILCVVNSFNAVYPLKIYRFFRELGARHITFLPLVERTSDSSEGVTAASVPAEAFGRFLIEIFDEWAQYDIGRVTIQHFEEALRTAFDQEHTLCIFKETCGGVPVVEHNGDVYSCDHYVNPAHLLGNVREHSLSHYIDSPRQKAFGAAKKTTLPRNCRECPVLGMCNGECPKNRFINTPDGESGLNYLCEGYRLFFKHCLPMVETIKALRSSDNHL
ncbi:MAG TPA: anaerobic sulfatase maturase [Prolixibacteraceae bacterium]|nr:anaerobic sulfatase maturase [Prolixibacteraceae bacterium]HOS00577.1 anaerobic sulfatase maturase [Prolixibacteraceae bacterium]HOS90963.1 anaerobic sulfatase maturase [Prolixibacteraceae bacterium]HPL45793.1 anaerobic sulfatase maturase [Prolixibacteraceae bacterium]HQE52834.1 anaerobic sulfatase maturase [Prolixibacteraceae bacterium]